MKFAIIVGHEKDRPGAMGVAPISQSEYLYNLGVASEAYRQAREIGLKACIFLKDNMTNEKVGQYVVEWAGDEPSCAIELHFNSFDGKYVGTETLYENPEFKDFADIVQRNVCSGLGRNTKDNRGIKLLVDGDRGHRNLDCIKIPCVIIEPGFGDNVRDAKLLMDNKFKYSMSLVLAVLEYAKAQDGY